jgi:malonyl-CoA decarboxylase
MEQLSIKLEQARSLQRPSAHIRSTMQQLASHICHTYPQLPPLRQSWERQEVLHLLATTLAGPQPDPHALTTLLHKHAERQSPHNTLEIEDYTASLLYKIRQASTPAYEEVLECLLRQNVQDAIPFLIALREDLSQWHTNHHSSTEQYYKPLDQYLLKLLSHWFAPGMLHVERLTYQSSSAALIERIAKQEAVHPIQSLDDLKVRLGPDRRVFGLFSPQLLPSQPLVVLHVALLPSIPSSMQQVQTHSSLQGARVACFYSISNFQSGLAGLGLGEYLIHQAVARLKPEGLETFVTLSPIPRFRKWLEERVLHTQDKFASIPELITVEQAQSIATILHCDPTDALSHFILLLQEEGPSVLQEEHGDVLAPILVSLAARYLVHEKHRRKPLCAVARFHVSNGARVYQIHAMADPSRKGWQNSYGLMVNYQYELPYLIERQSQYEDDYSIVMTDTIADMLSMKQENN